MRSWHCGNGKVTWRAAEHISQQHNPLPIIYVLNRSHNLGAAFIHVIISTDGDGLCLFLVAHNVVQDFEEFGANSAVCDKNHSDHIGLQYQWSLSLTHKFPLNIESDFSG